jgi:transcriptional regulator with XRE-family HTH domain
METVHDPATFGAAIRKRRREKGLTQTQLAELTGVSLRLISELERGRGSVSFDRALRIAQRLALDVCLRPRERSDG